MPDNPSSPTVIAGLDPAIHPTPAVIAGLDPAIHFEIDVDCQL
jgi:hypothetical protein